jgi:DNA-binding helix-hairpin-helix protein with protein kinase domain
MTDLFDSTGRSVPLGKRLGSGGEGTVYAVDSLDSDVAAKIYHEPLSDDKQEKLRALVLGCDDSLKRIAAWPFETLHMSTSGEICGFLMPKMVGHEPIHHLYSPAHRKQRYPDKNWRFLVNTARNTAAAFETIHLHGHVIGDVNPNLVLVGKDSIVRLVDCDSFQICRDGTYFLCEVGVPHFTPPELQSSSSFRGIQRTRNHDNFGLALLIFHILLMGRHPFSGLFAESDYIPIEKAIELFYYTFGQDAPRKRIAPPPYSVTPAILTASIAELFERAFSKQGCQSDQRPSAAEWISELDLLMEQTVTCQQDPAHHYFGGLATCPWCMLETQSGIYYFLSFEAASAEIGGFDLDSAWEKILAIVSPGPAPLIDVSAFTANPRPLPASLNGLLSLLRPWLKAEEKKKRQEALEIARMRFTVLNKQWLNDTGDTEYLSMMDELSSLREEYQRLADLMAKEQQKLQQNLRESRLQKFLGQFFLDDQFIPGIGSAEKAMLASFSIETAADIDRYNLLRLRRLNESLVTELTAWRYRLESQFVFDPSSGVAPADTAEVSRRFAQRRRQIETDLLAGPEQLNSIRVKALAERAQMLPKMQAAAQQMAQAAADLALLE